MPIRSALNGCTRERLAPRTQRHDVVNHTFRYGKRDDLHRRYHLALLDGGMLGDGGDGDRGVDGVDRIDQRLVDGEDASRRSVQIDPAGGGRIWLRYF